MSKISDQRLGAYADNVHTADNCHNDIVLMARELTALREAIHLILCKRESYDTDDEVLGQIFEIAHNAQTKPEAFV